jgi:hypothetical protein
MSSSRKRSGKSPDLAAAISSELIGMGPLMKLSITEPPQKTYMLLTAASGTE